MAVLLKIDQLHRRLIYTISRIRHHWKFSKSTELQATIFHFALLQQVCGISTLILCRLIQWRSMEWKWKYRHRVKLISEYLYVLWPLRGKYLLSHGIVASIAGFKLFMSCCFSFSSLWQSVRILPCFLKFQAFFTIYFPYLGMSLNLKPITV